MKKSDADKLVRGVVKRVYVHGPHGPYAVARANDVKGSITFSLLPPVWRERQQPEPGEVVLLSDIREKDAGWRAHSVSFSRLDSPPKKERRKK